MRVFWTEQPGHITSILQSVLTLYLRVATLTNGHCFTRGKYSRTSILQPGTFTYGSLSTISRHTLRLDFKANIEEVLNFHVPHAMASKVFERNCLLQSAEFACYAPGSELRCYFGRLPAPIPGAPQRGSQRKVQWEEGCELGSVVRNSHRNPFRNSDLRCQVPFHPEAPFTNTN